MGVLVHDCWAPYWKIDDGPHALRNAHLLRELLYIKEIIGQEWPQAITKFLLTANQLCAAARQNDIEFGFADVAAFKTLYDAIVDEGEQINPEGGQRLGKRGRVKQSIPYNLLRRFRLHADAVLLFISDHTVPFTNNVAERAVRMPKVMQKIPGCFRTVAGAENLCVIHSCLDTLRKQCHGVLDVLKSAFAGNPIYPAYRIAAEQSL
jgi:transposase